MEGRDGSDIVTVTRMATGTDVDYGALTDELLASLKSKDGFSVHYHSRVQDLRRDGNQWSVQIRDEKTGQQQHVQSKFVFIGAGGGTFSLLQKSGIPESHGYGGVSLRGNWVSFAKGGNFFLYTRPGYRQHAIRSLPDPRSRHSKRGTWRATP